MEAPPLSVVELANGATPREDSNALPDGGGQPVDVWRLWQLIDSAFPTGGFAHSNGLEAAFQHGEAGNRAELEAFFLSSLRQTARGTLPFVRACREAPALFSERDALMDCLMISNPVARRASHLQGRALRAAVVKIFPGELSRSGFSLMLQGTEPVHFATIFGVTGRILAIPTALTCEAWMFLHLRSLAASAVRLGIIGPMEGQQMQHQLSPEARRLCERHADLPPEQAIQTAPLLDLWQAAHDRLYSRLFQS